MLHSPPSAPTSLLKLLKIKSSRIIFFCDLLLNRYVREWLAILVCGKIVVYDRESNKYSLPKNYIPFLIPGKSNMTMLSRMLLIVGSTYEQLLGCFKNGGGIPYSSFTQFHAWMNEMSTKGHETDLIPNFVPSIEGMCCYL